jgi:hypothetical protein
MVDDFENGEIILFGIDVKFFDSVMIIAPIKIGFCACWSSKETGPTLKLARDTFAI